MNNPTLLTSSHAPYWHRGRTITRQSYGIMLAALPALIMGISQYGMPALAVAALSVSSAMVWELLMNKLMNRPVSIGDGNAAVIGLLFAMLLPAVTPWWAVLVGTLVAIVVGKQVFGGIGCNPFNPALTALAILTLSWKGLLDFNTTLVDYDLGFSMIYPLSAIKYLGASSATDYSFSGLLMGRQVGGIGSCFGLGLILGGVFLILRGHIRWEISISFLAGIYISAMLFNISDAEKYAAPMFHLLTGYTLIGAFFLATEDSSSPANFIPMLIYGAGAGVLTVLIRNIGAFVDGVVFAILMMNVTSPLLDRIRPKAMGKGI
ncbi:MAG: RnfABCDGE type electron transport complex subunit D [Desulfatiglans sp.]|nr:RnfABCDGE type electron transport complex subunit D [Thermodesulfobacteriota bacterium]MEE4353720.1 RnfABCDGE type electron transport complex subunit D [Desulfatiglans sp.]